MAKEDKNKSVIIDYTMWKLLKQEALDRDISIKDVIRDLMEQKGMM